MASKIVRSGEERRSSSYRVVGPLQSRGEGGKARVRRWSCGQSAARIVSKWYFGRCWSWAG